MGNNQHYKKEKSSLLVFRCLTAIQPTFNTCRNRLFLIKVENPEWEEKKKTKAREREWRKTKIWFRENHSYKKTQGLTTPTAKT